MNKLYFWLKSHVWRIVLWSFILFFVLTELGITQSYWRAFVEFCLLYSVSFFGTAAFLEKTFESNKKETKELADRIKR